MSKLSHLSDFIDVEVQILRLRVFKILELRRKVKLSSKIQMISINTHKLFD